MFDDVDAIMTFTFGFLFGALRKVSPILCILFITFMIGKWRFDDGMRNAMTDGSEIW